MRSTADHVRAMGREEIPARGYWHEARLTLLWLGQQIAVWSVQERSNTDPAWSNPVEHAAWSLECRTWRKV